MNFTVKKEHVFWVALVDGRFAKARAEFAGFDSVKTPGGSIEAEKIVVHYDFPEDDDDRKFLQIAGRLIIATRGSEETYWRSRQPNRQLLRMDTLYYKRKLSLRLIEEIRADYLKEDFYPRLKYFKSRLR